MQNAICLHEEDAGVLWKHTDLFTESAETRRQRRLVISFFVTVGNYDYGFYWYLYLDGTIELEVKSTGVLFTSAVRPATSRVAATEVAPGLGAPLHQHFFCARLDMTVDGRAERGRRDRHAREPVGADNPYGNAFSRSVDPDRQRVGRRPDRRRLGRPGLADRQHRAHQPARSAGGLRAARRSTSRRCWPTRARRSPGGPPSPPGTCGSPGTTRAALPGRRAGQPAPGRRRHPGLDRGRPDLDGADVVLWHTFGVTHVPRPEDWPVMPVDTCGVRAASRTASSIATPPWTCPAAAAPADDLIDPQHPAGLARGVFACSGWSTRDAPRIATRAGCGMSSRDPTAMMTLTARSQPLTGT